MKKKFLALVLTLAMVLSLAPVGALATDGEESQKPEDVIYNKDDYNKNAQVDGVDSLNKTAEKTGENTYKVTLEVKMHETTTTSINSQTAATVLVIDVSNSMDWHVVCGRDEHKHTMWCLGGLTCGETEHTHTDACGESRLDAAKTAAKNFVNTYAGSVENAKRYLSIVVFGTDASVQLEWTDVSTSEGKANATSVIDGLSVNGGTNLEQGLANAKSELEERTVASVSSKNVVALTDGAPTCAYSGYGQIGNGTSGSAQINEATSTTATAVKNLANLYTVCFGAENTETYSGGSTVGKFLENSIATDSNHAYNADNAGDLNEVFEEISKTITSGLSAGTVQDALPRGVTSTDADFTTDWDLSSFTKTEEKNGDRTDYTYTKTYTVTIDPDEIDSTLLYENVYYPLNGETTLKVNVDNEEQELNFQIPYGKVKFNTYSVTYKDGAKGAVFDDRTTDNLRKGADIPAYDNEDSIHRDGYTFSGWKWYQGETELTAKPDTMPAADLVAVAQWTAKTYTVTWKNGDTELEQDENVAYNTQPSYDSATPTKEGNAQYTYKFVGWSEDADATTGVTADKLLRVTKNVTYYAVFEEIEKTYTVTWKNGDTELEQDENVAYNTQPSYDSATPTKEGNAQYTYKFVGWSEDADATTGITADKLPGVKKNVIYYAIFEATPQTYTVIFNANGGAWSDSSEIKTTPNLNANAKITLPDSDPGSDGKKFQGWGYYPNGRST